MKYQEFLERDHFNLEELMAFAYGTLVTDSSRGFWWKASGSSFLMFDRILLIESDGKQGRVIAEQDIRLDAWYFQCHMPGRPCATGLPLCRCHLAITWFLLYLARRFGLRPGSWLFRCCIQWSDSPLQQMCPLRSRHSALFAIKRIRRKPGNRWRPDLCGWWIDCCCYSGAYRVF